MNTSFFNTCHELSLEHELSRECEQEQLVDVATRDSSFPLKRLKARHERILELASLGASNIAIADELGITSQTVCNVLRSSIGRARLSELNQEREARFHARQERLDELADNALSVYEDVFLGHEPLEPKEKVKLAGDILDRTGLPKTSRSEQTSVRATLTREQIEEINARASAIEIIPIAPIKTPDRLVKEETTDE